MATHDDRRFGGDIAQLYERYMVPLVFRPYAEDLAARARALQPRRVLEIAAGTGVLTRCLVDGLPRDVEIVASDLNLAMLQQAQRLDTSGTVQWRQADAMQLPFAAHEFDLVLCQFGAMFFPDRAAAFAEVHRVLEPERTFLFNVWDTLESNVFAACVTDALAREFPHDPPRFMARTPHGYHDAETIAADLAAAGFVRQAGIETVTATSSAASAHEVAVAYCAGTPLRNEIEARAPGKLADVIERVGAVLAARFGSAAVSAPIRAKVVAVAR